jgi:hypothetical protein
MADETKKTRGPMSEDARVLLAKRKFESASKIAQGHMLAHLKSTDPDALTEKAAVEHDDTAAFVRIVEKLNVKGRETLAKFIS